MIRSPVRNVAEAGWFLILAVALAGIITTATGPATPTQRIIVRFSPQGGCTALVAWHADRARRSLYVETYQYSSAEIHAAIKRTAARGVAVRIIVDRSMETSKSSLVGDLLASGFVSQGTDKDTLRIDDKHAIHHNKVMLRDPEFPRWAAHENGSFNYSKNAELSNAENAQVVEGFPDVTAEYLADWRVHWAHSRPVKVGRQQER